MTRSANSQAFTSPEVGTSWTVRIAMLMYKEEREKKKKTVESTVEVSMRPRSSEVEARRVDSPTSRHSTVDGTQ